MEIITISDDDEDCPPASQLSQGSLLESLDREMQAWSALASQASSTGSRKRKRSTVEDETERPTSASNMDRAQKAMDKKLEAERKKADRKRLKAEREAAKAAKAKEKAQSKALKTINKLVSSKKDTLPDMFIEICYALDESPQFQPIVHRLRSLIVEKSGQPGARDWPIRVVDELDPPNVLCWRRRVTARYDEGTRQFIPLDQPQSMMENARLLYLQKEHLTISLKNGRFEETVQRLRQEIGPQGLLLAMIDGGSRSKAIEEQLTMLMMQHRLNIVRVDGPDDAATCLYDITADLGFKPHRLLEKSHLPNIGETKIDTGANAHDTWYRMLLQVHRMTESAADGIMQRYPTFRSLMSAYEGANWQGERLLQDILITKRKDGINRRNLRLGPKLSNRVWRSFTSTDPNEHLATFGRAGGGLDDDDDDD